MRTIFLLGLVVSCAFPAFADSAVRVARTQENSLNDLVRELPLTTGSWKEQLRRRSAIQERLYLHELRMRGEGLPFELAMMFSANYSAILSALVEDRITEDFGREMLSVHRQLLERTRLWTAKRVRDEDFPKELADNVAYFRAELERQALPLEQVSENLRTPIVNGFEAWVGELIAWGESSGGLAPGRIARLRSKLAELERFERLYKADGVLQPFEREKLHERLLDQALEVVEVVSR